MTASIYDHSKTAASNTAILNGITLDGSVMTVPQIDNAFRDYAAQIAMFRDDITGTITAGGTADALTVTANSGFTSLANGRMVAFIAASDNTTAATLAVNGLSALAVRKMSSSGDTALSGGEIQAGGVYLAVYNSALNSSAGGWLLINPTAVLTDLVTTADGAFFGANTDTDYTLGRNDNDGYLEIQGGNDALGGKWRGYASGHATQAGDIEYYSNNVRRYFYDFSALTHQYDGTMYFEDAIRINQNSTDNPGIGNNTQGIGVTASQSRLTANANGAAHALCRTADGAIVSFCSGGSSQGSVSISGATTSYNTSSDERLKRLFESFDAGAILDALNVYRFQWVKDGTWGYGVKAQEAHKVFPDAILVGEGEPGDEDFVPWQADYSKFVPLLLAEVKALRSRLLVLENASAA